MNFLEAYAGGHLIGEVRPADKISHMASEFNDQITLLHDARPVSNAAVRRLHRLLELSEMGAQQLLEIRSPRPVPRYGKDFSGGGSKFPDHLAGRRVEFVNAICTGLSNTQGGIDTSLIVSHR